MDGSSSHGRHAWTYEVKVRVGVREGIMRKKVRFNRIKLRCDRPQTKREIATGCYYRFHGVI